MEYELSMEKTTVDINLNVEISGKLYTCAELIFLISVHHKWKSKVK